MLTASTAFGKGVVGSAINVCEQDFLCTRVITRFQYLWFLTSLLSTTIFDFALMLVAHPLGYTAERHWFDPRSTKMFY